MEISLEARLPTQIANFYQIAKLRILTPRKNILNFLNISWTNYPTPGHYTVNVRLDKCGFTAVQEDDQIIFSNFLTGNINAIVVEGKWMNNQNDIKNNKSLYFMAYILIFPN